MTTLELNNIVKPSELYIGIELSAAKWELSFRIGFTKNRGKTLDAWDIEGLKAAIKEMKKRFGLEETALVKSCYEAGQDGFSVHRQLEQIGIQNTVVDSASIEKSRRKKQLKTDRIDAEKLSLMLLRYYSGDRNVWSVARIPTEEEEDLRRTHRELERLKKESIAHRNRIRMLLKTQGIKVKQIGGKDWKEKLPGLKTWDGKSIPRHLLSEIKRETERLDCVSNQIKKLDAYQEEQLKKSKLPVMEKVRQLEKIKGVGLKSAWILAMEWFGWRRFNNVKEVGAAAGLVGVRHASGEMSQDKGISKIGNPKIRSMMIELAWFFLRYQPDHPLSNWFKERFGQGKRLRRIGIVAVARKLLIMLWKFIARGELAKGTELKTI